MHTNTHTHTHTYCSNTVIMISAAVADNMNSIFREQNSLFFDSSLTKKFIVRTHNNMHFEVWGQAKGEECNHVF